MRYLGGMDTMFVRAETRSMLLHVTGVLILDPAESRIDTRQQVRDLVAAKVPGAAACTVAGIGGLVGSMFPGRSSPNGMSLAPRSPYNGALSDHRVVALGDASLIAVKKIKTAFGVTVNDVVLAAVAASLRGHLGADQATVQGPLTAAVPVSVRPEGMEEDYGNHTSAMMISLPTDVDDPVDRLMNIHESSVQTKEQHRSMGPELIERWAGLIPPWVISTGANVVERFGLGSYLPPVFNVIVSNVAGPPIPIYLAGAEVTAIYPLGPLMEGGGLNISVISRRDRIHVGVIGDSTLVKEPSVITDGFARAIDELLALTPRTGRTPRTRRSTTTAQEE